MKTPMQALIKKAPEGTPNVAAALILIDHLKLFKKQRGGAVCEFLDKHISKTFNTEKK